MENINIEQLTALFSQLQSADDESLKAVRKSGFTAFKQLGLPTAKTEEWKYTRVRNLFNQNFSLTDDENLSGVSQKEMDEIRLPGFEHANQIVFVNGKYSQELSTIISPANKMTILPLEKALESEFKELVLAHINKSSLALNDGLQALNTSLINHGIFIHVSKNQIVEAPIYIYHINNATANFSFAQPRSLVFLAKNAKLQIVENYITLGTLESFTNEVMEIVVDDNAFLEHYKIQNDVAAANQVNSTHIRQIGKCNVHTFTLSLSGGTIRNNTYIVMETAGNEAHMFGLYLLQGKTHVDNHTLVDNTQPNCYSNELYKGIMDEQSTGVFSGKIVVRQDAQKTNAYQSNKNILLSDEATINSKPQLEIFADDVKCSHGCTVGQLDEEALFYLRSRGMSEQSAKSFLLQAFASDILEQVKISALHDYLQNLVADRLLIN